MEYLEKCKLTVSKKNILSKLGTIDYVDSNNKMIVLYFSNGEVLFSHNILTAVLMYHNDIVKDDIYLTDFYDSNPSTRKHVSQFLNLTMDKIEEYINSQIISFII